MGAAPIVFANAAATNFLALRSMKPEHYDKETRTVFVLQKA